jgi:hypothetical protein
MAENKATPPEQAGPVAAAEAALDRLAARLAPPSIGAQIRRLLPKIEAAIDSGASHEQIVETLRESGIDISLATFRSALYRARKKAARGQGGGSGKEGRGSGSKAEASTGKTPGPAPEKRDPLAVPRGPKSFDWDPTARPEVTFIKKDDGEPES